MLIDGYKQFIKKAVSRLKELGIDISNMDLDHFGFQASSDKEYDRLLPKALKSGILLTEQIVNGRRVSIIKLNNPLKFKNYYIQAYELVAPKKNQICKSGLEHIEVVIDGTFYNFIGKYPELDWDISKMDQKNFPMITLKLWEGAQVKFHYKNVLEIAKELADSPASC